MCFEEIGNSLDTFYEVDLSFQDIGTLGWTRILVGLETSKGLAEELVIKKGEDYFQLTLDYEGIPFICG
jgi:hypothetical protein